MKIEHGCIVIVLPECKRYRGAKWFWRERQKVLSFWMDILIPRVLMEKELADD